MAEAAFREELKRRKIRWYTVRSAGLFAQAGEPINPKSAQALSEAKIPFDAAFAARPLTQKTIAESYAVVCMTQAQKNRLSQFPNVTCMSDYTGKEIPDPYGRDLDEYRAALRAIRAAFPRVIEGLRIGEDGYGETKFKEKK